jgi:hypothetical protein
LAGQLVTIGQPLQPSTADAIMAAAEYGRLMAIRILEPPEAPWGDYGHILVHGMASHLDSTLDGVVQLERTGPYIPPISFPGFAIVVTDECRKQFEASRLNGVAFRPVHLARIVDLPWHTWDRAAEEPAEYPDSGEPEDYVLERNHAPQLAEAMNPLWELAIAEAADVEREPADQWNDRIYLKTATWTGVDIFGARGVGYFYVSDDAQAWLTRTLPEHVAFRECLLR